MSILLITHDLGVVAEMCDSVAVMYAGKIVEQAPVDSLYQDPEHPYTIGLMNAIPRADLPDFPPVAIDGSPPDLVRPPLGCRFQPRCPYARAICFEQEPELRSIASRAQFGLSFCRSGPLSASNGRVE